MYSCAIGCFRRHAVNKFVGPDQVVPCINRFIGAQSSPYRWCFLRRNSHYVAPKNRTFIGWQRQRIFGLYLPSRTSPVRSRSSTSGSLINNGKEEKQEENVNPAKKQLKSDDLFRILSLAKPEYKNLAGKLNLFKVNCIIKSSQPARACVSLSHLTADRRSNKQLTLNSLAP